MVLDTKMRQVLPCFFGVSVIEDGAIVDTDALVLGMTGDNVIIGGAIVNDAIVQGTFIDNPIVGGAVVDGAIAVIANVNDDIN
jgi:hypothetical protein